ncbi:nuclear transport factor 2 family protein [Dyadobacter flavalbus]|uniref:Nuclear transport factor 2 family protein n=1 Tax=Dyadobacter flavalbus TaxID=2579942 RepID=A0A5M8QVQ7_9BACT|nr:nuclear transport factor 2 family protein [Dyadobacter flavalbus]
MEKAIRDYLQAYNDKNVPAMLEVLDEKIVFENISNSTGIVITTTIQEFEQLATQSLDYFTERRQLIRFLVIGGDSAAVEIDYQARLAVDFPNGMKAGDMLQLRGVSIFEMKKNRFTRISDYS